MHVSWLPPGTRLVPVCMTLARTLPKSSTRGGTARRRIVSPQRENRRQRRTRVLTPQTQSTACFPAQMAYVVSQTFGCLGLRLVRSASSSTNYFPTTQTRRAFPPILRLRLHLRRVAPASASASRADCDCARSSASRHRGPSAGQTHVVVSTGVLAIS